MPNKRTDAALKITLYLMLIGAAASLILFLYLNSPPISRYPYGLLLIAYRSSGAEWLFDLPYSMYSTSLTAVRLLAYATIACLLIKIGKEKKAGPIHVAAITAYLLALETARKGPAEPAFLAYPLITGLLLASKRGTGRIALPRPKALKYLPIIVVAAALLPVLLLPYTVDITRGSAIWTHYRNAWSIYNTGLPGLGEGFYDNRFLLYPPFSHYIAAGVKGITGLTLLETFQALFPAFGAMLIAAIFLTGRELFGTWAGALWALLVGLASNITDAAFFGSYAQLAGNALAFSSLLFLVLYSKHGKKKHLTISAMLFGLAFVSHWLVGILFSIFFAIYFFLREKKGAKHFATIALLIIAPYLAYTGAKASGAQGTAWMLEPRKIEASPDIISALLPTKMTGTNNVLLALGAAGFLCCRKRWLQASLITAVAGYYLLQDTLLFAYPNRLLIYIKVLFSAFVAIGAAEIFRQKGKIDILNLLALAVVAALLASNLAGQAGHIRELNGLEQQLGPEDRTAVTWLRENSNSQDAVATDTLRAQAIYGFTQVRIMPPAEAVQFFEASQPQGGGVFVYISNSSGACRFPCSDIIEMGKDASTYGKWEKVSYAGASAAYENGFKKVFEENRTLIYRNTHAQPP